MEKKIKQTRADYSALQEELERRYGPGLAQDIVEQIIKSEEPENVPGYMAVKAVSEVMELFRNEARDTLRELKIFKGAIVANDNDVLYLEAQRLRRKSEHYLALYFLARQSFYRMYHKAIGSYRPGQEQAAAG